MIKASYFPVDLGDFHMSRPSTDHMFVYVIPFSSIKSLNTHKLQIQAKIPWDRIFFLYRGRRILEAI